MKSDYPAPEGLERYFEALRRETAVRDLSRAEASKSAFLQAVKSLPAAVSDPGQSRLNQQTTRFKERHTMIRTAISLVIALALVFGSGGITALAAQSSMPEDALYPVKLLTEDAQLALTSDTETLIGLEMQFADRRTAETVHLIENGLPVSEPVLNRLLAHLETSIALAAAMPDASDAEEQLVHIRQRMETHSRISELAMGGNSPSDAALLQASSRIRQRLELLHGNLADPAVREQIKEQLKLQSRIHSPSEDPGTSNGPGGQGTGNPSPGDDNLSGSPNNGETSGAGYGSDDPGHFGIEGTPSAGDDCKPGSGQSAECETTPQGKQNKNGQ